MACSIPATCRTTQAPPRTARFREPDRWGETMAVCQAEDAGTARVSLERITAISYSVKPKRKVNAYLPLLTPRPRSCAIFPMTEIRIDTRSFRANKGKSTALRAFGIGRPARTAGIATAIEPVERLHEPLGFSAQTLSD